jgi:integral membrane protein
VTVARFRLIAVAETVSWLAMLVAVAAKRGFGVEDATAVVGPVHGVVFLAYLTGVVFLREELDWSGRRTCAAVVAAVVPFGAHLVVERHLLNPGAARSPARP